MSRTDERNSRWPAARRVAWLALFWAILGWAAMVDPSPGVWNEPLPIVGYVGL